ncbi:hypothetical protein MKI84_13040 [Ancylobacter sp. A5.8]|uniref:hypothetical protein n=1 Tax=Ancylobacter gelatini TaxID=2919920 RepID=UPI001F4D6CA3|nr:hypothetical protein [Ancylobacter gelatini]MCJ8143843.1 hypothetical protein [Ancylobacter gelatini]
MIDEQISQLQGALNEASLILECSSYLLESEHRDPARWREMIGILNNLARARLSGATAAVDELEAAFL